MNRPNCHRCQRQVIHVLDDMAVDVTLDPTRLSLLGEALAVLAGRRTWQITDSRRHGRDVWKRVHYLIGRDPGLGHLHTAHDCDQPVPDAWKAPEPIVRRPDPNQEPQW
jgi:hypothetical protein